MKNYRFRVNEDVLLTIDNTDINFQTLHKFGNNQYVNIDSINNTVFASGINHGKINKVFNSDPIITESNLIPTNNKFSTASFKIRAGLNLNNIFGFLVIIYNPTTEVYLMSEIITIDRLDISPDLELFYNDYWNAEYVCKLDKFSNDTIIYVSEIVYSDFNSDGTVLTYPNNFRGFTPLINDDVLPPEIMSEVRINNQTNYLEITPYTTISDKTIKQVILDYFGFGDKIIPVEVSHVIKYGNDEIFEQIRVSNEINYFGTVRIGLDFTKFLNKTIDIFVQTVYKVDNKIISRDQRLVFDRVGLLDPIVNELVVPKDGELVIFPVEVVEEHNYTQQVIKTEMERKVNVIYQNIMVEIVSKDFTWDNKSISFTTIPQETTLARIEFDKTVLWSTRTVNGLVFDLSTVNKPEKVTTYKIYSNNTNNLILTGNINI